MPAPLVNAGTANLVRTCEIIVNGAKLSQAFDGVLTDVRVEHSIGQASRAQLQFSDEGFHLIDDEAVCKIGNTIEVGFGDGTGTATTAFKGEITAVGIEQTRGNLHSLVIEAHSKDHRLGSISKVRTFADQKFSAMVSTVASDHGLSADVDNDISAVTHKYYMLVGTDADLLDEIALHTGAEWFVDDTQLIMRKRPDNPTAALLLQLGDDSLITFKARYSGTGKITKATVNGWDPKSKIKITGASSNAESNPPGSTKNGGSRAFRTSAADFAGALTAVPVVTSSDEAVELAKALATRQAANELIARGTSVGAPTMRAGTVIQIAGIGDRLTGDYYVTNVEHVMSNGDLVTKFTAGGLATSSITDLLGARRRPSIARWGHNGLVVGVVDNLDDPDDMHRVRVKYDALSEQDTSAWARVALPGAGPSRGLVAMPSIGDEVLIGFEQGDYRRPYVLGGLWNGTDKAPEIPDERAGSQTQKYAFVSTKKHQLTFNDIDDAEAVSVELGNQKKTKLNMTYEKIEMWAPDGKIIEIKSGEASITLNNGDITIKGKKITIEATDALAAKGMSIELKAKTSLKAEGGTTVEVKGSATGKFDGGGMTEIKGGMVKIN